MLGKIDWSSRCVLVPSPAASPKIESNNFTKNGDKIVFSFCLFKTLCLKDGNVIILNLRLERLFFLTFVSAQSNSSWRELRYGMNISWSSSSKISPFGKGISLAACWSIVFTDAVCGAAVGTPEWNNLSKSTSHCVVLIASKATRIGKLENSFSWIEIRCFFWHRKLTKWEPQQLFHHCVSADEEKKIWINRRWIKTLQSNSKVCSLSIHL